MARRKTTRRFGAPQETHQTRYRYAMRQEQAAVDGCEAKLRSGDCNSALDHLLHATKYLGQAHAESYGAGANTDEGREMGVGGALDREQGHLRRLKSRIDRCYRGSRRD